MPMSATDLPKTGFLAVAAALSVKAAAASGVQNGIPHTQKVAIEAERIVQNTRHTKYQHKQFIDEASGTYDVDCSDYVSYVLFRIANQHLKLIPKESWWPVPRAYKFFDFFAALPTNAVLKWRRVVRLQDARQGDIITWSLPGQISKTHDTGHVWIVAARPVMLGEQVMAVQAYDSANLVHYDDSRAQPDGSFRNGVGTGTFHLRVDASGKPVAFQFGPTDNFHENPIAIGRILPLS